jgi:hypothetical protein
MSDVPRKCKGKARDVRCGAVKNLSPSPTPNFCSIIPQPPPDQQINRDTESDMIFTGIKTTAQYFGCWCKDETKCNHLITPKGGKIFIDGVSGGWYLKKPEYRKPTDPLPKARSAIRGQKKVKLERPVLPKLKEPKNGTCKRGRQKRERGKGKDGAAVCKGQAQALTSLHQTDRSNVEGNQPILVSYCRIL